MTDREGCEMDIFQTERIAQDDANYAIGVANDNPQNEDAQNYAIRMTDRAYQARRDADRVRYGSR